MPAMPDVTKNQIIAIVGSIVSLAVSVGLVDDATAKVILAASGQLVAVGLLFADAMIRHGRAKVAAAKVASEKPAMPVYVTTGSSPPVRGGLAVEVKDATRKAAKKKPPPKK